ncbi:hypothetical protein, partial [Megasphaera sp.]|uniref:hypothetical protein n=1 Tax=Megasphaera sp. TaxID=2023260 RepID=UPI003FEF780C
LTATLKILERGLDKGPIIHRRLKVFASVLAMAHKVRFWDADLVPLLSTLSAYQGKPFHTAAVEPRG